MYLLKNIYYRSEENALVIIKDVDELKQAMKEKRPIVRFDFELVKSLDKFGVDVFIFDNISNFDDLTNVNMQYYEHPAPENKFEKIYLLDLFCTKYLVHEKNLEDFATNVIYKHNKGYWTGFRFNDGTFDYTCPTCSSIITKKFVDFQNEIQNE